MTTYIAFLRGINVGVHKRMKMADLITACTAIGLQQVQTYIQSGNIIFQSDETAEQLASALAATIDEHFGFEVPIIIRTLAELEQVIAENPFAECAIEEVCVNYFNIVPTLTMPSFQTTDRAIIIGKNMYVHMTNGYRNTPYVNTVFEKQGVQATNRNWKTLVAVVAIAKKI